MSGTRAGELVRSHVAVMLVGDRSAVQALEGSRVLAKVGMTEFEARQAFGEVDVYRAVFRAMKTTFYHGEEQMLMKVLVNPKDQKVVGVHIVGPDSGEMIQMAAIAVKMGVTKQQWDSTCAVHPTAAEELVTMKEKYIPPNLGTAA